MYHGSNADTKVLQRPTKLAAARFSGFGDLPLAGGVDTSQLSHYPMPWARRVRLARGRCGRAVGHSCALQVHFLLKVVILGNRARYISNRTRHCLWYTNAVHAAHVHTQTVAQLAYECRQPTRSEICSGFFVSDVSRPRTAGSGFVAVVRHAGNELLAAMCACGAPLFNCTGYSCTLRKK